MRLWKSISPNGSRLRKEGDIPVIVAANGRIKPNWVLVNGRPEKYEAGIYYLDWRENGKRQRLSVGRDSDAAHQRKIRKLAELRALSQGLVVTDVEEEANKNHVKVAVHDFLEEVQLTKQDKTCSTWRTLARPVPVTRTRSFSWAIDGG